MSVTIRKAVPADAPLICMFIHELAEYEREAGAVKVTAEVMRQQMERPQPPFECLIAEVGGQAVGYALFCPNYSTWIGKQGMHLEDLYVSPKCRGCGVGRALFMELVRIARERGYARMDWQVIDWNEQAIQFYASFGASNLKEWGNWRLEANALQNLK